MCDFVYCDLVHLTGLDPIAQDLVKGITALHPAVTTGHIPNANTIEYCRGLEEPTGEAFAARDLAFDAPFCDALHA